MNTINNREKILARYAGGPSQLQKSLRGLTESDLDMAPSAGGWSIREIVHHIADGDDIWKFFIRMALGNENAEFQLDWYQALPQIEWASKWAYARPRVNTSLDLLKVNRTHILNLLDHRPEGWELSAKIREPNGKITGLTVGFVIEMQADHVFHHIRRIREIRREHGV